MQNQSIKRPVRFYSPSIMLCIGQCLIMLSVILPMFITPLTDRWFFGDSVGAWLIMAIIGILFSIIWSSIAIARLSNGRVSPAGAIMLLISSVLLIPAIFVVFVNIDMSYNNGYADARLPEIIAAIVMEVMMIISFSLLSKQFKPLRGVTIAWAIFWGVMLLWGISVVLIDPYWRYNDFGYNYRYGWLANKDSLVAVSIVSAILMTGTFVTLLVSWVKTAKCVRAELDAMPIVEQTNVAGQQYYAQQQPYGQAVQTQSAQHQQFAYQPQAIDPQVEVWAKSLTVSQLKYVILNPSAYHAMAVNAAIQELAHRD